MYSFHAKVYCCLNPKHPPFVERRIWKVVVRALFPMPFAKGAERDLQI